MSEEQRTQQTNTAESTVHAAAKAGKAVANIAKGAATGGVHGAALATAKNSKKWIIAVVAMLMLPVLIIAMLPSIIFGSFSGDGTNSTNAIVDDTVLAQNIETLYEKEAKAAEKVLGEYSTTNHKEYFAEVFDYWIQHSDHSELAKAAPETHAYFTELEDGDWMKAPVN